MYEIDMVTGQASLVVATQTAISYWSADGRKILYGRPQGATGVLWELDLASGREKQICQLPARPNRVTLSPDGRFLAPIAEDVNKSTALVVTPVDGGKSRELLRVHQPDLLVGNVVLSWPLGGSALVVVKQLASGVPNAPAPRELWLAPVSGEEPRKLDIDASQWDILGGNGVSLGPDGRHIAFMAGKEAYETWAMEGLLATLNGGK